MAHRYLTITRKRRNSKRKVAVRTSKMFGWECYYKIYKRQNISYVGNMVY